MDPARLWLNVNNILTDFHIWRADEDEKKRISWPLSDSLDKKILPKATWIGFSHICVNLSHSAVLYSVAKKKTDFRSIERWIENKKSEFCIRRRAFVY